MAWKIVYEEAIRNLQRYLEDTNLDEYDRYDIKTKIAILREAIREIDAVNENQ